MHPIEIDPIQAVGAAPDRVQATPRTTTPAAENRRQSARAEELAPAEEDPVVQSIRRDLTDPDIHVGFFMVEGSSQPVIRIYNRQTGEVVRQIPDDAVLHLRERFAEMLGVIMDRKV